MRRSVIIFIIVLFSYEFAAAQDISGYWGGRISSGGQEIELFFDIKSSDNNSYSATMDVPVQGVKDFPVDTILFENAKLILVVNPLQLKYEGVHALGVFIGRMKQMGMTCDLTLSKSEKKELQYNRPQEPKEPFPYMSEDVEFVNGVEGNRLAGTLTIPKDGGPFPAVVLVSGSGAQDRNEELMGHKPFLVLSDYLTRNGIAVLRYDDRGVGGSEPLNINANTSELSYDAEAALEYLKGRKEIDGSKIGIMGHSEGGPIAFMVAARNNNVAFIISLAGPAISGGKVLSGQQRAITLAQGMPEEAVNAFVELGKKVIGIIRAADSPDSMTVSKVRNVYLAAGMPDGPELNSAVSQYTSQWMFDFIRLDPADYIKDVTCPIVMLNGSKDLQVIATDNLPAFNKITEGRTNVRSFEIEGVNHLFQRCTTGAPSEYVNIEETMSPEVLELILAQIEEIVK